METQLQKYDPESDLAPVPKAEVAAVESPKLDAAQARVGYVAQLLSKAYERASTLEITPEESEKIMSDFPDEAISRGANGDQNLIYIEHAFLRERLHKVFGPGKWSLILRQTWAEDFTTKNNIPAARVYADCALLIRGCFVGDAVGTMIYFKNNATQNYSDALEGAKSSALSRIAGKDLSIGLQCWKKSFGEAWKQRNPAGTQRNYPPSTPKGDAKVTPAENKPSAGASPAKPADVLPKTATAETLKWFIAQCEPMREQVENYLRHVAKLLPTEPLEELSMKDVPTSKAAFMEFTGQVDEWIKGQQPEGGVAAQEDDSWRPFLMPFGKNTGIKLEDLEKPYLFGLWANYEVETEYNGKPKKPETIAKDQGFRRMLDLAGIHYQFTKD